MKRLKLDIINQFRGKAAGLSNRAALLAFCIVMSISAYAQMFPKNAVPVEELFSLQDSADAIVRGGRYAAEQNHIPDLCHKTEASALPPDVDVIYEAPAGQTVKCRREASGIYPLAIYVVSFDQTQITAELVKGDDGYMYIRDILTYCKKGTYVRGEVEGTMLKVPLGQYISYNEDSGKGLKLVKYIPVLDEDGYVEDFLIDEEATSVYYTIGNDGSIVLEEGTTLGAVWSDDNSVAWYCDMSQGNYPFDLKPVEKPQTAVDDWALTYEGKGRFVPVGIDGGNIYIGGLSNDMPDSWIKGSIQGDRIVFDTGQYMGECYDCYQYLCFAKEETDSEGAVTTTLLHEPVSFNYDAAKKEITPAFDVVMMVNGELDRDFSLVKYHNPMICYPEFKAATPRNPELIIVSPFDPDMGYGYMAFDLPNVDVENRIIDVDGYCYNIFLDGAAYTLTSDLYKGLNASELTDIPYTFNDEVYRDIVAADERHEFIFYTSDFVTIGVQGVYTVDGVTNKTDIVTCNIETGEIENISGVDKITTDPAECVDVAFYDLSGRRISNLERGTVYIQRILYSDGTARAFKKVAK